MTNSAPTQRFFDKCLSMFGIVLMVLGLFLLGVVGFQLTLESFLFRSHRDERVFGLVMLALPFAAVIYFGGREKRSAPDG